MKTALSIRAIMHQWERWPQDKVMNVHEECDMVSIRSLWPYAAACSMQCAPQYLSGSRTLLSMGVERREEESEKRLAWPSPSCVNPVVSSGLWSCCSSSVGACYAALTTDFALGQWATIRPCPLSCMCSVRGAERAGAERNISWHTHQTLSLAADLQRARRWTTLRS
jgi:hypothetical protein